MFGVAGQATSDNSSHESVEYYALGRISIMKVSTIRVILGRIAQKIFYRGRATTNFVFST